MRRVSGGLIDPYEHEEDVPRENVQVGNIEIRSNMRWDKISPPNLFETMRSFNERLIKSQEEKKSDK